MDAMNSRAAAKPTKRATRPEVLIYCDGACSPNPGLGGWGVVLLAPEKGLRKELSGAEAESTNNRMELTAAIEGLRALKRPSRVRVITDSEYLQKAFTQGWLERWRRNGWRTADKKPVKNIELWQALMQAMAEHDVEWSWTRGHGQDEENNRCDKLAVAARQRLKRELEAEGRPVGGGGGGESIGGGE